MRAFLLFFFFWLFGFVFFFYFAVLSVWLDVGVFEVGAEIKCICFKYIIKIRQV